MKRPIVIVLLTVALVLVLAGIGAVLFFTIGSVSISGINSDGPRVSMSVEESKTLDVDGPVSLKVLDESGEVTVTGADVKQVTVKVMKTGFGPTQAKAEAVVETINYKIEQKGDSITLTFNYPKSKTNIDQTVDFIVTVPLDTKADIEASLGKVGVSNIQENVTIVNSFGDITVNKVDGALSVNTESGRIDVSSVKAGTRDIDLHSGFGDVNLEQVSGTNIKIDSSSGALDLVNVRATRDLNISSSFGSIKFETGTVGTLEVQTESGSVNLASVTVNGVLTIRDNFGDITLEKVQAKSYDLETSSGSITVDNVKGPVKAHTGFGDINLLNAEAVTLDLDTQSGSIDFSGLLGEGPHVVHSDFGNIELNLPADSALNINLKTDFGNITSDIPITVILTGDITNGQQSGTINGGGTELKATTNSGSISIKILK